MSDEREMWSFAGNVAEEVHGAQLGEGYHILNNVHPASACEGRGCPIHHPSNHHMVTWKMNWRDDRGLMERICPAHGVGHPDPDDIAYKESIGRMGEDVHGCCGCCRE